MGANFLISELLSLFKSSFIESSYNLAKTEPGGTEYWQGEGLIVTFFYIPFQTFASLYLWAKNKTCHLGEKPESEKLSLPPYLQLSGSASDFNTALLFTEEENPWINHGKASTEEEKGAGQETEKYLRTKKRAKEA